MKRIYVITSSLSDIGKGWVASSLGNILKKSKIIKIDPVIKRIVPNRKAINMQTISSDYATYCKLGNTFNFDSVIRGGELIYDFLSEHSYQSSEYNLKKSSRYDFRNVADFFCIKLGNLDLDCFENIIIEMGGSINDEGSFYIIDGIRKFAFKNKIEIKIVLITFFLPSEDNIDRVKTSIVKDSVNKVVRLYKQLPEYVFIRDHYLKEVTDDEVKSAIEKLSHNLLINPSFLIREPTFNSVKCLRDFIIRMKLFPNPRKFTDSL